MGDLGRPAIDPAMSPRRARRRDETPPDLELTAYRTVETDADGDWVVRAVTGAAAVKTYRCPGCDQEIRPGLAHVVAWLVGAEDDRRHWHRPCWQARRRRGTVVQRSRNAPRHG
jgi:hypothetical protein